MREIIIVIDVLAALGIVALVLLQQGKGADMGAAFGSGSSATLFGSRGTANFLSRTTAVLAVVFFVCNIVLASSYFSGLNTAEPSSVTSPIPAAPDVPAAPSVPAPTPVPEVPK